MSASEWRNVNEKGEGEDAGKRGGSINEFPCLLRCVWEKTNGWVGVAVSWGKGGQNTQVIVVGCGSEELCIHMDIVIVLRDIFGLLGRKGILGHGKLLCLLVCIAMMCWVHNQSIQHSYF